MNMTPDPPPRPPESLRPVQDLAGAHVDDAEGRPTGTVYGSLAEARSGLIRYIDLSLRDSDRHVLVPIGHIRVNREDGQARVRLRAAVREDLAEIPPYEASPDEVDGEYQTALLAAHGRFFYGERYYAHPAYDHSGLYAGDHPIVRDPEAMEDEDTAPLPLTRLSRLPGYRIAAGEPDIRSWRLFAGSGEPTGFVRDLVIEPPTHTVRYAVLELRVSERTRTGRRILLPIGFLRVGRDDRTVRTPALTPADLHSLPTAPPRPLTRADEMHIRRALEARLDHDRRFQRPDFAGEPHHGGPAA